MSLIDEIDKINERLDRIEEFVNPLMKHHEYITESYKKTVQDEYDMYNILLNPDKMDALSRVLEKKDGKND